MSIHVKLQERAIVDERTHDIHSRFAHMELLLRNLVYKASEHTHTEYQLIDKIKHSIVIFSMKDKVCETNDIFIENTKEEFYSTIDELIKINRSVEWDLFYIKLFVEDFYLNPIQTKTEETVGE